MPVLSSTLRLKIFIRAESPTTPISEKIGLGSSLFARRYLGNRVFFLFLRVLRCFSSPACLLCTYGFSTGYPDITPDGLPHSGIHGSMPAYGSPWHFAADRALLRLLAPRHPPYALCILTYLQVFLYEFFQNPKMRLCNFFTCRSIFAPLISCRISHSAFLLCSCQRTV